MTNDDFPCDRDSICQPCVKDEVCPRDTMDYGGDTINVKKKCTQKINHLFRHVEIAGFGDHSSCAGRMDPGSIGTRVAEQIKEKHNNNFYANIYFF